MSNQSVISIPPNVEDAVVLRRVLSRIAEVLDQVVGTRESVTQGAVSRTELTQALDQLRNAVSKETSAVSSRASVSISYQEGNIQDLIKQIANLAVRVGINETDIQVLIQQLDLLADRVEANEADILYLEEVLVPGRLNWRGAWDGTTHYANDVAYAGGRTAVALTETTDSPAILPQGTPAYLYAGTLGTTSSTAAQVVVGQRYTFAAATRIDGYRLDVVAGNTYTVLKVKNPLGTPQLTGLITFIAGATGEVENALPASIAEANEVFDMLVLISAPSGTPIDYAIDTGYWTGSSTVKGLFSTIGSPFDVVEDTNAYGLDLKVVQAYRSPDWESFNDEGVGL